MTERISANGEPIPIGIVGAGRTRGGLGPFLAEFVEREGFFVAGVSGRSLDRATVNAEAIGRQLDHKVNSFATPAALCASGVAALIIASPAQFHLEALQAAVDAGLPVLCEKPFVHENDCREGAKVIEAFAQKRLPLVENCQWPYVLPAFLKLHGSVDDAEPLRVEMGLGPPRLGRVMVQNTVSHLLSVIQVVTPLDFKAVVREASIADPSYTERHNNLRFAMVAPGNRVEAALHLHVCGAPPRPAWLAINSRRIDRNVGNGYSIGFSANGDQVAVDDPVTQVVKRFALLVRTRDPELIEHDRDRIRQRLEWYRQILDKLQ